MNRVELIAFLDHFTNDEFITKDEIEIVENKVKKAIVDFRLKTDNAKTISDKKFWDGATLTLQWFQEELINLKRGYYK